MTFLELSDQEATCWGIQLYRQCGDNYKKNNSEEGKNVVSYYCGLEHIKYNSILRKMPYEPQPEPNSIYDNRIKQLKKIILDSPRTDCNLIVWRIVPDHVIELMKKNFLTKGYFLEKGFLSTSLTKEACWENFHEVSKSKIILQIKVPSGTAAIYTPCFALNRREQELLINYNIRLYFDNFHKEIYKGQRIQIIQVHAIHDDCVSNEKINKKPSFFKKLKMLFIHTERK